MNEAISVTKFNSYIKNIFDAEELLHNISIVGEIFGVSVSRNVIYFSLKDENATLSCVCFYPNLINEIKEGEQVIVTGSPNFYVKGGRLSFNVVKIENVGQGKLFEEFLKMKAKLEKEGLFDVDHKKQIPENIRRIGVITSKEGAVIQDIKNVAWRRNPNVDIVLFNTKVQGFQSEKEIANAIDIMGNYPNIDVIIVARGGGSLEDLWAYNTEIVARATYNCPKPIVSAVGHETDFTIIDFVSDLRAPTPSAAAELLTYNLQDKKDSLISFKNNLIRIENNILSSCKSNLQNVIYRLHNTFDKTFLSQASILEKLKTSLVRNFESSVEQKIYELGIYENTIEKINPLKILEKGYARIEQGKDIVKTSKAVDFNQNLKILFRDGEVIATPIKDKGE